MVQTAVITFLLILMMFLFTDGEKKEHNGADEGTKHQMEIDAKKEEARKRLEEERHEAALLSKRLREARLAREKAKEEADKIAAEAQLKREADEAIAKFKEEAEKLTADVRAKKVAEVSITIPTTPSVPKVEVNVEKVEAVSKDEDAAKNSSPTTLLQVQSVSDEMLDKLNEEHRLKEEALAKSKELQSALEEEEAKERGLVKELEAAKRAFDSREREVREAEEDKNRELQTLLEEKKEVELKVVDLEGRIAKMLKIAEDATEKAKAERKKN